MMTVQPNRKSKSHGQALVEFGLVLPVLLLIITGIIDFGQVTITYIQSLSALRNAARYAEVAGFVSVPGQPIRYLDCEGMRDAADDILFADNQTITIRYHKADNYGTTSYTCDNVTADLLRNGDVLEITSQARVRFITPLVSGIVPDLNIEFAARRTIIKAVLMGSDDDDKDTDYDGLLDEWEMMWFGNLDAIATGDPDGDGCNNGCEEARNTQPIQVPGGLVPDSRDTDGEGINDADEAYVFHTDGTKPDTDDDGLTDFEEVMAILGHYTDPLDRDSDGDSLTDGQEVRLYSTDPNHQDTDTDGISDYDEVAGTFGYITDPLSQDSDGDGLLDYSELMTYKTSPVSTDTDNDRLSDADEVAYVYKTSAIDSDSDDDLLSDGDEVLIYDTLPYAWDTDGDGLSDYDEVLRATDPKNPDTDNDNVSDGEEVNDYGSDPLNQDSDGDTIIDGDEVTCGTSPTNIVTFPPDPDVTICNGGQSVDPDTDDDGLPDIWEMTYFGHLNYGPLDDPDFDGLFNHDERIYGTHGKLSDTDGDGRSDGDEVRGIGGPTSNPKLYDTDGDGLSDGEEITTFKTNPNLRDTDGDGLNDYDETKTYGTNALQPDTDSDGLSDGEEIRLRTYPTDADSDDDGLNDGEEVNVRKTDPNNSDTDRDGLSDFVEVRKHDTNPLLQDSDGDKLTDREEIEDYFTYPTHPDSDRDGLDDWTEVKGYEGNPLVKLMRTDPMIKDTDRDGIPDGQEIDEGTLPNNLIGITVVPATFKQDKKDAITWKFKVTLDKASREDTHFNVTTLQGSEKNSATFDKDFERITNRPYVISAGALEVEVGVIIYARITGNESPETFIVELTNRKNAYFKVDRVKMLINP